MSQGRGRPSDFTQELADTICLRLSGGESLRTICKDDGIPSQTTIFRWLAQNSVFREQYTRAREAQTDHMAEELLDIADDGTNDYGFKESDTQEGASANPVFLSEHVQRSKLRVDTRKWLMSKMAPKKYGESIRHEGEITLSISDKLKEARDRAASGD